MKNKTMNTRRLVQWTAFAIALGTYAVYGLLFATKVAQTMSMNTIHSIAITGYVISTIFVLLSFRMSK